MHQLHVPRQPFFHPWHAGHCLASAGDSGELLIWKTAPGSIPAAAAAAAAGSAPGFGTPLQGATHKDTALNNSSLARSPSQALGSADGSEGAAAVGSWKLSANLRAHHDDVTDVAWSHDDGVVMSGSVENEVMMFDVDTRRPLVGTQRAGLTDTAAWWHW